MKLTPNQKDPPIKLALNPQIKNLSARFPTKFIESVDLAKRQALAKLLPVKKKTDLEIWLDTKVKKNIVEPYSSIYNRDAYYHLQDIDMINYDMSNHNVNTEYMDHIYIDPSTNRYHANMLFRMLIDYAYESDMDYTLNDPETRKPYLEFNLMDRSLKKDFYKFCYEN